MFLIDTNIISEIRKRDRCNASVANWYASVDDSELFISVLALGEIRKGIALARLRRDFQQADTLENWLQEVKQRFSERILPIDAEVVDLWGQMYHIRNVPVIDGLLAATAKARNLILVTRNISDVQGLGATLLNPFAD